MRRLFDFRGNEIAAVMKLVAERMEILGKQPPGRERDEEMRALGEFTVKMVPVITAGEKLVDEYKASMN